MDPESNGQDQIFDIDYIDKLFSSRASALEGTKPAETPEASADILPEAPAPVKKRSGRSYLLPVAAVCLLLGFLLGRLPLPEPEPTPGTTAPSTGIVIDPGFHLPGIWFPIATADPNIGTDYASMSTQELVIIATQISDLSYFGDSENGTPLYPVVYNQLKRSNPVLAELELRPDAVEALNAHALRVSSLTVSRSANALIQYYVNHLGFELPGNDGPRFSVPK